MNENSNAGTKEAKLTVRWSTPAAWCTDEELTYRENLATLLKETQERYAQLALPIPKGPLPAKVEVAA